MNDPKHLERMNIEVIENLRHVQGAPGVAMSEVPPDAYVAEPADDDDPEERMSARTMDARVQHDAEFYDSDEDVEGTGRGYVYSTVLGLGGGALGFSRKGKVSYQ